MEPIKTIFYLTGVDAGGYEFDLKHFYSLSELLTYYEKNKDKLDSKDYYAYEAKLIGKVAYEAKLIGKVSIKAHIRSVGQNDPTEPT